MISFIIPAYNEEALIGRTLEALNQGARTLGEDYEIVVADDASSDSTAQIAIANGARVVRVEVRQIAATRNAGAREAKGDKLVFIDADTVVSEAVLRGAIQAMNDGASGGGSAVNFDGKVPRYAERVHPTLVRIFRALGIACGCFLFCTRRAFEAAGGFDETLFASEEIAMSRALKRQGRFIVLREAVTTSGRKLRMYSGREIIRLFGSILLAGPKALKSRDALEVWYGGRREDSDLAVVSQQ
ncbi:MAG TPA: glycosyltransferase [Blastocatellia bacterium]|jgi:glycosyltransferase involved in cell wall biosynthesis|nr:glycosyltransferase [Blastocatellia bacterium]